MLFIDKVNFA